MGLALVVAAPLAVAAAQLAPPGDNAADPTPTTRQTPVAPPGIDLRPFQPGVAIDWHAPAVYVAGEVVLTSGPLEFVACFRGKEHESLVRMNATATHVYLALGLIGLTPAEPPDSETKDHGDWITVRFLTPDARGDAPVPPQSPASWMSTVSLGTVPPSLPFRFQGSQRTPDGALLADRSGAGIAIVDMPDALLTPPMSRSSANAALWALANAQQVPPRGTPVTVVLAPYRATAPALRIDAHGGISIAGVPATPDDLAAIIRAERDAARETRPAIELVGTLQSDWGAMARTLTRAGLTPADYRVIRRPAPAPPAAKPSRSVRGGR